MKYFYNLLRIYLQLVTGEFIVSDQQVLASAQRHFHTDWILGKELAQYAPTIPNKAKNLLAIGRQLHLLHERACAYMSTKYVLRETVEIQHLALTEHRKPLWEFEQTEDCIEIGRQIQTNFHNKNRTKLLIGSKGFRENYYHYFSPDELLIKNARQGQSVTPIDAKILELHLLKDFSHISYNWVNKLLEYRLNGQHYDFTYIYDYQRLVALQKEQKFYESSMRLAGLVQQHLRHLLGGRELESLNFPEIILLHYRIEQKMFADKLLPTFGKERELAGVL